MKRFFREIDLRNKSAMIGFLTDHFRYNTMNSWNASTSYANNLKIHKLGLEPKIADKLYEMMYVDGFYDAINDLIDDFAKKHDYLWQAGFNGRSGGYLVLYMGGKEDSGYRSYCPLCGQKNYRLVPPDMSKMTEEEKLRYKNNDYSSDNRCGRCGSYSRINYQKPPVKVFTYPGKSVDMNEDFLEWSMDELRERVRLVQDFDRLCDAIVDEAVYLASEYEIEETEILVPQTVKCLQHR